MATVEVPLGLAVACGAYTAVTLALGAALLVLASPALVINRLPRQYFDDWNAALKAPWLFWHVGSLLFRLQELFGNYVVPAPQRICDMTAAYMRSQVCSFVCLCWCARGRCVWGRCVAVCGGVGV